ncbi:MAG TPA: 3-hydroxyacyl-CoA dehydrogenase NAD-binding domain-containing protein, partial [Solirubrobacterales bacterium]|nr:3-hydroxyacyl-CoA dehydrogenase NAD-binding domain-containing protein [Solirubrobacterales bacterium]
KVVMLVRSEESADRALTAVEKASRRIPGANPSRVTTTMEIADLAEANLLVEAVVEDAGVKADLLRRISEVAPRADLATTTSSLSITKLGEDSGAADRVYGLHVFNPVPAMQLVELIFPDPVTEEVAERAHDWCHILEKTAVEVPDTAGFAVNRLLFPYLFDAVRYQERTGLEAAAVDQCMTLGVAHPMGPLALLDLVGLDVAVAIGQALNNESGNPDHIAPATVQEFVAAGHLGRKTGQGFYEYG